MPDAFSSPLPTVLRAHAVSKRYGDVIALDGVSIDVAQGECVALVGESGAGKTTLLRCFNRMVEADAGEVEVDGASVRDADPIALRRHVGYVPQDGGLLPHWTVRRNVGLVPWLRGESPGDAADAADIALALVGLPPDEFGERRPRQLSGGQRQRVAIARALAARPSVVLLDEPFGALDAITRGELQESFAALRAELRMTAALVTHDLHEAARLADRIAVFRAGRIEQLAPTAQLIQAPATPYVRMLLARSRLS
ncbi:MAG TPA: ATP-binding cassette domain-containing protein [Gemmatimonadaceae bacterium]|nr:ATP-binding cassette domain-containing protein [Gemmatimonadaceae bacterium]